jgi:ATP-binding cassette subfamily C (CFTR/MRP) protein 1
VAMASTGDTSVATVAIEDASFTTGEDITVLHDISMAVHPGSLCMVVGRVGCGKSSLLKAIAGELTMTKGRVIANTPYVAYCDQAPWLQNITIRDNIVGQSAVDEKWLSAAIRACALDEDISAFPAGDMTIVGSGGVALSGGQKQRVVSSKAALLNRSFFPQMLTICKRLWPVPSTPAIALLSLTMSSVD